VDAKEILEYLKSKQNFHADKYGVKIIGIFGSYARNEANKSSDIDILYEIKENKKLSLFAYLKLLNELKEIFKKDIDLVRNKTLKPQIKEYVYKDLKYV
jgi:predicted nucleotidyltransferase